MQIDRARHTVQFLQQVVREGAVAIHVESDDLHIDRRGQTEVQYLGDHVRRQERECRRRIAGRKFGAQLADEVRRGLMVLVEIDEYVGIPRTDRRGSAVRQIDAAVGKSQIVVDAGNLTSWNHLADGCLDCIAKRRGLLYTGAGARTQVQLDLAGVDGRKEVLAETRQRPQRKGEQGGRRHGTQEYCGESRTAVEGRSQQGAIPVAHLLEASFEALLQAHQKVSASGPRAAVVLPEPELGESRNQGARQNVRGQHREHHRLSQGDEQELGDTGEQEHGYEHDADRQGRDQRRQGNLARAAENRRFHILTVLEMIVDVLDGDRRVVDQDADRQRESAQCHDVDRLAQRGQAANRRQDRQGDRNRDDQGAAPTAQEQQDQQARQRSGDHGFANHAGNRPAHEHRLVAERLDLQIGGQRCADLRQLLIDAVYDVDRGRLASLQNAHQYGPPSFQAHHAGLRRVAVADMRNVVDISHGTVVRSDRQIVQILDLIRAGVELDEV